jgi:hypothetical protein
MGEQTIRIIIFRVGTGRRDRGWIRIGLTLTKDKWKTNRSDSEEQELRAKLRREQEERKVKEQGFRNNQKEESWDYRGKYKNMQGEPCYNCNMVGHLRNNCSNPPYCYCCKKSGHRSTVCPEKRGLRLCGYGILGQGFYSIRVPVDKEIKKEKCWESL